MRAKGKKYGMAVITRDIRVEWIKEKEGRWRKEGTVAEEGRKGGRIVEGCWMREAKKNNTEK